MSNFPICSLDYLDIRMFFTDENARAENYS